MLSLFPRHFSEETLESAGRSLHHLVTFFVIYMGYVTKEIFNHITSVGMSKCFVFFIISYFHWFSCVTAVLSGLPVLLLFFSRIFLVCMPFIKPVLFFSHLICRSPERVRNPHLRAKLAQTLEALVPIQRSDSSGLLSGSQVNTVFDSWT